MKTLIYRMRIAATAAMIGCVFAGALFGWMDLSFDPRIGGASAGAIWAIIKFNLIA